MAEDHKIVPYPGHVKVAIGDILQLNGDDRHELGFYGVCTNCPSANAHRTCKEGSTDCSAGHGFVWAPIEIAAMVRLLR